MFKLSYPLIPPPPNLKCVIILFPKVAIITTFLKAPQWQRCHFANEVILNGKIIVT